MLGEIRENPWQRRGYFPFLNKGDNHFTLKAKAWDMSSDPKPTASHKILVILPDGRTLETSIVLTIDDMRDRHKTVIRMHGGSPQMIMSAKEALMVDISEAVKALQAEKIEVVGQYKTDILVYYSPTAFSADQKRAIEMANQVYAQRLMQLEKQRRFHLEAISRLKALYEEERKKSDKFVALAQQAKDRPLTPEERERLVLQARQEAMEMVEVAIKAVEAEKADLEKTVESLAAQIQDSISLAQHSEEMERLKREYDQVNKRAMMFWTKADFDRLTPEQLKEMSQLLPKTKDDKGNERLFDIVPVLKLGPGEQGLKEGTHVLAKYRPAAETKYFIGRLFFNDTKDYICLGQGFEITSGVYGDRDRSQTPTDEEVLEFLKKNPLSVQIYLDAVRYSSIQTVQFWLHDLRAEQMLEIQSIDDIVYQLMKEQMKISYVRTYEIAEELRPQQTIDFVDQEKMVDQELESIKRIVVQPIVLKYMPDEQELRKKLGGTQEKMARERLLREMKGLHNKKISEVSAVFAMLYRMLQDEMAVGRGNLSLKKYPPSAISLYQRLTEALKDRMLRDERLLESIMKGLEQTEIC